MEKTVFFSLCFIASTALLWPIACALDLAGVSPWTSPHFVFGLMAVAMSGTISCLTLFGVLQD